VNILKTPLFNFLLGIFFGMAIGAAFATHELTKRVEQANRECTAKIKALLQQRSGPAIQGSTFFTCTTNTDGTFSIEWGTK
jgi:hypothetical protein